MTRLERLKCELNIRRQEYEFIKQDGLKWYRTAQYKDYNKRDISWQQRCLT